MTTLATYHAQDITNIFSVTKERAGYGQWTLRAEFQTEDGQWHKLSAHCTDSMLIDRWSDAIADDDMEAVESIWIEVVNFILAKNY